MPRYSACACAALRARPWPALPRRHRAHLDFIIVSMVMVGTTGSLFWDAMASARAPAPGRCPC